VTIKNEDQMAATDTPLAGKFALTFFFNFMEKWGCSEDEQKVLLGGIGNDVYHFQSEAVVEERLLAATGSRWQKLAAAATSKNQFIM